MSARKQRFLAFALRLLGLMMIVVDLLKSGRSLSGIIPQTPAWDKVNNLVYVSESFLGYNVGNLLPSHSWALIGVALVVAGVMMAVRLKRLG